MLKIESMSGLIGGTYTHNPGLFIIIGINFTKDSSLSLFFIMSQQHGALLYFASQIHESKSTQKKGKHKKKKEESINQSG